MPQCLCTMVTTGLLVEKVIKLTLGYTLEVQTPDWMMTVQALGPLLESPMVIPNVCLTENLATLVPTPEEKMTSFIPVWRPQKRFTLEGLTSGMEPTFDQL